MLKRDFFLEAVRNEAYRHKVWVFNMFSITRQTEGPNKNESGYQLLRGEKHYYYLDDEENPVYLEDTDINEPPFRFKEEVSLSTGELPNVDRDLTTTYGNVLFNMVVLVYAFNDKISFKTGLIKTKAIEAEIEKRLISDGEKPVINNKTIENPIYVSEFLNYVDAIMSLEGYSQLCVPSASRRSLTSDPELHKRRDELLEKYKDRLNDPSVVAKIEEELIAIDKAWIKGDISEGFYHQDKSFNVIRKKMHMLGGYESAFGQDGRTVKNSLVEGWNLDDFPTLVNSLREGTYNRGAETQLGGVAAKTINRMFQNTRISEEDCGSTLGIDHEVTEKNKNEYIGFYRVMANGSPEAINEGNVDKYVNKTLTMRSPMFCKTSRANYCKTCLGNANSENPTGLGSLAGAVGSQLLYIKMKKMHGTSLKTVPFDLENTFV